MNLATGIRGYAVLSTRTERAAVDTGRPRMFLDTCVANFTSCITYQYGEIAEQYSHLCSCETAEEKKEL